MGVSENGEVSGKDSRGNMARSSLPGPMSRAASGQVTAQVPGTPGRSETKEVRPERPRTSTKLDLAFLIRLCGIWNDLTSVLTILLCIWALYYANITPMWQFENADDENHISSVYLIASIVGLTAFAFEVLAVVVEYSPAAVQNLPPGVDCEDSKVMTMVYAAISLLYLKMALRPNEWVHSDVLAFGGARPVYTLRFLEWSICMPLLFSLSGPKQVVDEGREEDETEEPFQPPVSGGSMRGQVFTLLSIPGVVGDRLSQMRIAPSARGTAIYIWSSWLALVVDDEFTRWLLLNVSFYAYVVAALEQSVEALRLLRDKDGENGEGWAMLLISQIFLAFHYGIIYLGAAFGFYSWRAEQILYTASDMGAKLFHSSYLISLRRQCNLIQLQQLRAAAINIALDLRNMIRKANVPIFVVNKQLEIEDWNLKIAELTGIRRPEAVRQRLEDFFLEGPFNPSWLEEAGELLRDALQGRDTKVVEICFPRGPTSPGSQSCVMAVSASAQRATNGEVKGAVCIGQDITDINEEKQKAQNLAEGLNRLIETANAPIFEVDLEYALVKWNSWLVNTTGLSRDQVLGKHISSVLNPNSRKKVQEAFQKALTSTRSEVFEVTLLDTQDKPATLLLAATPCLAPTGQTIGAICIGQDITSLKDLSERKASMMAMVSHELKSPLHGIIGVSGSLLENPDLPKDIHKSTKMMHSCAQRLLDMVSNIMDTSVLVSNKRMRMTRDPVQMESIIEEVITLCQEASRSKGDPWTTALRPGVTLINETMPGLPVIEGDAYRCSQLIYNLVSNAIKFTHEGSITVSAHADNEAEVLTVEVADTGIGISPENQDRIFLPFDQEDSSESRRYAGLGLGLSISREVVMKHGGTLAVESAKGQGSTFRVKLPYVMRPPEEVSLEQPQAQDAEAAENAKEKEKKSSTGKRKKKAQKSGEDASPNRSSTLLLQPRWNAPIRPAWAGQLRDVLERPAPRRLACGEAAAERGSRVDPVRGRRPCARARDSVLVIVHASGGGVCRRCASGSGVCQEPLPSRRHFVGRHASGCLRHPVLATFGSSYPPELLSVIMVSTKGGQDTIANCLGLGANDYVQKPFGKGELLERIRLQLKVIATTRSLKAAEEGKSNRSGSQPPEALEHVGLLQEGHLDGASSKLLDLVTEEMKSVRSERDKALKEVGELQTRVQELLAELAQKGKDCEDMVEHRRCLEQYARRQEALMQHHQYLSEHINRMQLQQKLQHQLVSTKAISDFADADRLATFSPADAGPPSRSSNMNLQHIEKVEASVQASLQRISELGQGLQEPAKSELQMLALSLRQETNSLLLDMGQKCHLLDNAESKLQAQALQFQLQHHALGRGHNMYAAALASWPSSEVKLH